MSLVLSLWIFGGFTIRGSGDGVGVLVDIGWRNTTIQGPGTITNFGIGVFSMGIATTVQNLTLTENGGGINFFLSDLPRLISNTIDGGARGVVGISVSMGRGKIKGIVITGNSEAGSGSTVNLNM
jgi:hypothetical protein